jgi:hypothetical protein
VHCNIQRQESIKFDIILTWYLTPRAEYRDGVFENAVKEGNISA